MSIKILKRKSLLYIVKNSIGSNQYRNLFAIKDGEEVDLLRDGDLSCSIFVSHVLLGLELIKKPHLTVDSTIKDMRDNGWYAIEELREGAVLLQEERYSEESGLKHRHLAFYIGNEEAVSSRDYNRNITRHHYTDNGKRGVEKIFWNKELEDA